MVLITEKPLIGMFNKVSYLILSLAKKTIQEPTCRAVSSVSNCLTKTRVKVWKNEKRWGNTSARGPTDFSSSQPISAYFLRAVFCELYELLTKLVRSRWLDIGQVLFFFVFLDRVVVEVHEHSKRS